MDKHGSFRWIFIVLIVSLLIGFLWDTIPAIKNSGHAILDPSVGILMNWNMVYGMIIIVFIITLVTTIIQKYATDQKAIKELKAEQKKIQQEMKNHKDNPSKMLEFNKQQMELFKKMMPMTMRPVIYTGVPIVLFFRWFHDYFTLAGDPKFFGIFSWFWFYIIVSIIFSIILRKLLKVD
ncbi:MAG: EMC3/TMCO1 family protein [Nanoarchaeota archaeon]